MQITLFTVLEILGLILMAAAAVVLVLPWTKLRNKQQNGAVTEEEKKRKRKLGWLCAALFIAGFLLCMPNMFQIMMMGAESAQ